MISKSTNFISKYGVASSICHVLWFSMLLGHINSFVHFVLVIRWWEGLLVELNEIDESKGTVYFPGENDTQIVKVWDLRPSMQWEDGKWVPWANSVAKVRTFCITSLASTALLSLVSWFCTSLSITPSFLQFRYHIGMLWSSSGAI